MAARASRSGSRSRSAGSHTRAPDCRIHTERGARTSCGSAFVWWTPTGQAREMLLIAAPGQGAQAPGFLREGLALPGFAGRLVAWSELLERDLIRYGTTADADEIRDTAIAQPLLVPAAIAAAPELRGGPGRLPRPADAAGVDAAAGHSLGELAARALPRTPAPHAP